MILVGLAKQERISPPYSNHTAKITNNNSDENNGIDKKDSVEQYDEEPIKFKQRGLKSHDEAILFVCGSGKVAGASYASSRL